MGVSPGQKKSGRINEVVVRRGSTVCCLLFEKRVFFASEFIVISQLQEHIVSFTVTVTIGREDILVISTINAHGCKKKQNKTKTKTKQKRPDQTDWFSFT